MIRLIIFPLAGSRSTATVPGSRQTRPGRFTARLETDPHDPPETGLVIVLSSPQPLVDGARRLLELGQDPAELLTMRHAGKAYDSFEPAPIGQWAKVTYAERDRGGLRVETWKPHPRSALAPKVDKDGSSGT